MERPFWRPPPKSGNSQKKLPKRVFPKHLDLNIWMCVFWIQTFGFFTPACNRQAALSSPEGPEPIWAPDRFLTPARNTARRRYGLRRTPGRSGPLAIESVKETLSWSGHFGDTPQNQEIHKKTPKRVFPKTFGFEFRFLLFGSKHLDFLLPPVTARRRYRLQKAPSRSGSLEDPRPIWAPGH